ncbi:cytochrome P450 [Mycena albidolilacea]|uniref:Cytochrome P450 n=1 Tax=Mycena albidolilacea TaxID=1033008 RepID=A0AAD7AHC3_9AGAR|nr:cytochrome P450 [Mycena albidolilacea]
MISVVVKVCALLAFFYGIRLLRRRLYSPLDNVPGPQRSSYLTGNLTEYLDPDGWAFQTKLENNYGRVVKLEGLLGTRILYVFDPAAMHSILVKDQDHYAKGLVSLHRLLWGTGILSTLGDEHRKFRKMTMPAFSTANLRRTVPTFYEVARKARDGLLCPLILDGPQKVDLNNILSRTSLELIGRTGIGYSFDPMLPGQERADRYAQALRSVFPTAFKFGVWFPLIPLILKFPFPSFLRFMINVLPIPTLRKARDITDFTTATAQKLVSDRKQAIREGTLDLDEDSRDIMALLMNSSQKMADEGGMHLTDEELTASTSMIIFAATDTTSSSMNRLWHLIAQYPDVQENLRAEILAEPETMDHDTLVALPYLDAVVREVLRLYPPISPTASRDTVEDSILPLSTPIIGVDGTAMSTINVPKGTPISIAIAASNHDKQIWGEDALEFRPERWINGKAESVTTKLCGIYGNTMTFLGGGRSCIGFKFAQLEMKVVACVLLRAFKFSEPDPRIKWRMTDLIPSPYVDNQPALPIVVEQLRP